IKPSFFPWFCLSAPRPLNPLCIAKSSILLGFILFGLDLHDEAETPRLAQQRLSRCSAHTVFFPLKLGWRNR
ncbi:MAG: hypothetical protein ABI556_07320, partial [Gemmatimonadales bacterium]